MTSGGRHAYNHFGVERGFYPVSRLVFMAAFLAIASAAPAGAQELGLWQRHIGEGVAYGEPRNAEALSVTDPVAALPIAPRLVARAAAPVVRAPALAKPVEPQPVLSSVPADRMDTYNPDLPLPHPDLDGFGPARRVSTAPRPYLRGDDQGAVFGLTVPLSPNRVPLTAKTTRSGAAGSAFGGGFGNR